MNCHSIQLRSWGSRAAWLVTALWTVACPVHGEEERPATKRPNILLIMSDDHATQAIGSYGGRLAGLNPTPVIDSLAAGGMRFDRVFCHNSICTPSRANILTGQYSQSNGVLDLEGRLPVERQHLAREMKQAGYQTAVIGKWHLRDEPAAFDHYCVLPGQGRYFNPEFLIRGTKPWPGNTIRKNGQHSTDAITDLSLEWLKHGRDKSRPFLLMHHFKAPHDMYEFAERYRGYLADAEIPAPENLFVPPDASTGSRGMGSGLGRDHAPWRLGRRLGISDDLHEQDYVAACHQEYLKRYLRCVKGVDDNIRRLLEFLKESGELENTLIIYTSDQGLLLGEHDLMDKRWFFEESMRMPFIVHWPAVVRSGSVNRWLINNTDFAPTLLEIAGAQVPDLMQGRSFAAALRGEAKPADWRTATYYRYWMHMAHDLAVPAHFALRSADHKLVFYYGIDALRPAIPPTPAAWEFYDLKTDPGESKNQYGNPAYKETIAAMKRQLRDTRETLGETDAKFPEVQKIIDAHWDD